MPNKNKNPQAPSSTGLNNKYSLNDNRTATQRQRLLDWLREMPITTIQARTELNVLAPAARIFELRHNHGLNVKAAWVEASTPEGRKHRIAKYYLCPGKYAPEGSQPREA